MDNSNAYNYAAFYIPVCFLAESPMSAPQKS